MLGPRVGPGKGGSCEGGGQDVCAILRERIAGCVISYSNILFATVDIRPPEE